MAISLPQIIQSYIDASNAHDVKSILACFADDAVIRDENTTRRGKIDIEHWAGETIDKYKFHLKLIDAEQRASDIVVSVEVSGIFAGSPVTLDYHFVLAKEKILSLFIDS